MKVEKMFDKALWLNEMLPKLINFYMLPCIVY